VKNPTPHNATDRDKVLQPLAQAFAAGLTEAARKGLQSTASVSCLKTERTSLRSLLQPASATVGLEIVFESGLSGAALLLVAKADLARIAGLLAGLECGEDTALAPEFMEANLQFFAEGVAASCRAFSQSCGLPVRASAPAVINADGQDAALHRIAEDYSDAACLGFEVKLENLPADHIRLLVHGELLASLNAQLPQYAATGKNTAAAAGSGGDVSAQRWNIDLILDVELEVAVSFGQTQMPLRDVLKLGVGSVIELEKGVNDPVTILVHDKPIVKGEVVVVNGNYGVKVLEVESTADRIRSLGR
jgi:flagellar motor switch protein FliN